MKRLVIRSGLVYSVVSLLFSVFICNAAPQPSVVTNTQKVSKRKKQKKPTVRVLLDQKEGSCSWQLQCDQGFIIKDADTHHAWRYHKKEIVITSQRGHYYLNGTKIPFSSFLIKPDKDGMIAFNDKRYPGTFTVVKKGKKHLLINRVDLEEYLELVVRSEGWPGWPLEVNKVLAIASRSYVAAMMERAARANIAYDVCDSNFHQRYNLYGIHGSSTVHKAVVATKGIVLTHEGSPILAMFDSCCGGIVSQHIEGFDFEKAPYLARDYSCTFCKKCSAYEWEIAYNATFIQELFKNNGIDISSLKEVKIVRRDKAGLVKEVSVKDKKKEILIEGKRLYTLLPDVKSFCFHIKKKGDQVLFSGYGLGHHLGLCQWGAREMVRQGYPYKHILAFYYPGTELKRLRYS